MNEEQVKRTVLDSIKEFFKGLGGSDVKSAAEFSEADRKKLADDITKDLETKFSEELKTRDTKIEELTKQVDAHAGSSNRAGVLAFFESMQAKGVLPLALKERVVKFMDALSLLPDKKVTVIEFAEEGGNQVEKKTENTLLVEFQEFIKALPPYIKFGESFGNIRLKGDGKDVLDPQSVEDKEVMRAAMGLSGRRKEVGSS